MTPKAVGSTTPPSPTATTFSTTSVVDSGCAKRRGSSYNTPEEFAAALKRLNAKAAVVPTSAARPPMADPGRRNFRPSAGGQNYTLTSRVSNANGAWRHLLVEVDRERGAVIYVDGRGTAADVSGSMPRSSLANGGDFFVGGGRGCRTLLARSTSSVRVEAP